MEEADETDFAPALMEKCWHRYDEIIQAGWAPNPDYHPGKHAKKRPEQVNLLDRRDSHREEVLRFATDLRVPFARNGSDRDIRPLTIKMKASSVLPLWPAPKYSVDCAPTSPSPANKANQHSPR